MSGLLDWLSSSGNALLDKLRGDDDPVNKTDTGAFDRMLEGMDYLSQQPPHASEPLLFPGPPQPVYDQATNDKYIAQRGMRGLADLVFGLPDLANIVVNAAIRDVDYFTGGGLSGGSYDPFQFGMASQGYANGIAKMSGADIVTREAVSPETRRVGEYVELGAGMLPIGVGGLAAAGGKSMKTPASRSSNIYDPPAKPARPFELDYPEGAKADDTGRLLEDIDGQPLSAEGVVGRRMVGGTDVPLPPSEYVAVTEATIGSRPQAVAAGALPRGAVGKYREGYAPDGSPERDIYLLNTLSPDKATKVTAHEMGHMFDSLARKWAKDPNANIPAGAKSELNFVYNDLNNPDLNNDRLRGFDVEGRPRKVYKGYKPEHSGYNKGPDSDAELIAEFARAYMADPNYVKTVAPKAAKWWRSRVNSHPSFRNLIQFNSLAGALAPVGLMGYLASQQDEQ